MGRIIELHAGAAPRVLLAYSPVKVQEEWRSSVTEQPITPRTPKTALRVEDIEQQIQQIQAQGFAISDQDVSVGIAAVGAPIFGHDGTVVAALSVSGIRDVILGSSIDVPKIVINAAGKVSKSLGYRA